MKKTPYSDCIFCYFHIQPLFKILSCLLCLFSFSTVSAQSSFTLPADGKWYKVATIAGHHGYIDYIYWHDTAHNPSIAKGEIQLINSKNFTIQNHQTMGYGVWNQPQFALLDLSGTSELWVKSTNGILPGTFKINSAINVVLVNGATSDTNLADNGGTLIMYDKLADNSHIFIGNVAIGTTRPGSYQLAVEGKVGAREVNVTTTNPWPDYVFSKDYKLPSLIQVEDYIKANKHLPEIPSEAEVNENGVNLGEINALLLKKVEELTLYVIELKKESEVMKQEIEELRKENGN